MLTLTLALTRALTTDPNPDRDPDPNQVGPSPAIMHVSNLRKLAPLWYELSVQMKADREADGAFGWMLEMCAQHTHSARTARAQWEAGWEAG